MAIQKPIPAPVCLTQNRVKKWYRNTNPIIYGVSPHAVELNASNRQAQTASSKYPSLYQQILEPLDLVSHRIARAAAKQHFDIKENICHYTCCVTCTHVSVSQAFLRGQRPARALLPVVAVCRCTGRWAGPSSSVFTVGLGNTVPNTRR